MRYALRERSYIEAFRSLAWAMQQAMVADQLTIQELEAEPNGKVTVIKQRQRMAKDQPRKP